jgi:uncharacterized membrane protein YjgN (DUF898 family)
MGIGTLEETAFSFDGDWRELAPILFTNLMLSIVTLGFYRFWGIARERRYLWSKTRFIDDRLEWTGTGKELFLGFLLVIAILFVPLFVLQFVAQALLLQGQGGLAGLLILSIYLVFFYVAGLAIFRGLRYRLSRTHWHGIRGGSEDPGFSYGWSYTWKTIVGSFVLGLLIPWSMTSLWSERWNRMSFGPHNFESGPEWGGLMRRFLLCYLVPVVAIIGGVIAAILGAVSIGESGAAAALIFVFVGFYVLLPILALAYYAAFLREMIGTLSLSTLDFEFTARTKDWLLLMLGNVGLYFLVLSAAFILAAMLGVATLPSNPQALVDPPIGTFAIIALAVAIPLGLVGGFVRYRNWHFFIRHLEAGGEINLVALTQSRAPEPRQGEGLLDALDMGGF